MALPQFPVFLPGSKTERVARYLLEFGVDRTYGDYMEWHHAADTSQPNFHRIRKKIRQYFDILDEMEEKAEAAEVMAMPPQQHGSLPGLGEAVACVVYDPPAPEPVPDLKPVVERLEHENAYLRWRLAGEQAGFMERALTELADGH